MMYEDDLNPNIPDSLYTQWFQLSEIVDGVRMGPEVRFSDLRGWYIESEAAAELARREAAPADRAFAIAQGEQDCREQAQHTPGRACPWCRAETDTAREYVDHECDKGALINNVRELAAEVARLRAVLAEAYSELLLHHLSKAGDLGIPHELAMTMIGEMPLMQRIKAAKEATDAK